MIRDHLFDPLTELSALFGFGSCAEPPDSVPLRILGLDAVPLSRDTLRSVFRAKVRAAHPDVTTYTMPHLREAAEALVAAKPDVQELMWARDVLMRKIPETVTTKNGSSCQGFSRNNFDPDRYKCRACKSERINPDTGKPYRFHHSRRWRTYCWPCGNEAELARQRELRAPQRELRARRRANRTCQGCGATFTPGRADGRFCSNKCRQAAYRQRARTTP
jgi:hypothetical protein